MGPRSERQTKPTRPEVPPIGSGQETLAPERVPYRSWPQPRFGAAPEPCADPIAAHAWLRAGPVVLLGGEASVGFVPVTSYHSG